jgi:hypothetical protein
MIQRILVPTLIVLATTLALGSVQAQTTPGETSGSPLAPLLVTDRDPATGEMRLSYQSGCDSTDNNIYIGPLEQVSSLAWSDEACSIGTTGTVSGFNPGAGSYFFVIVGNDGIDEGSYGQQNLGGSIVERGPHVGSTCGEVQNLANACRPAPQGGECATSADCGARQTCVEDAAGGAQCVCLGPFAGDFCESCEVGYAGRDCRECEPGYASNEMQNDDGGDLALDLTAPEVFRCVPDVPGDCSARSCSGSGTCVVSGRDAVCACDPGYSGAECQDCAPNYERDAFGRCSLGQLCRDAKCGGHGDCVATPFGDVACSCDAGSSGSDCGGPELSIAVASETRTLYDGETVVLEPMGGSPPYDWRIVEGPARLVACDSPTRQTRDVTACPPGAVELTIVAPSGGLEELELVKVNLTDGPGVQTAINLAAIPPTVLPITGELRSELVPFYGAMLKYMRARGIRGGVLGISKGGSIIATNGYGYRDAGLDGDPFVNAGEGGPLVQPDSPFRIASVSKPLTAAAVRQAASDAGVDITSNTPGNRAASWVQQSIGFSLVNSAPPFNYNLPSPLATDNRWANVTIQHLLNHHVGFWRDSTQPAANGLPASNSGKLPFTVDPNDPNDFQTALTGTSNDISYATMYSVAALRLFSDPRPTVRNTILFTAGNTFDYTPGGVTTGGQNYANIGYILAGRVLEGLMGATYDPDDPMVPMGWGQFPLLLQDYLCESSGIQSGIYPGDNFNPQPGEPYYRDIDRNGNELWEWNLAEGADKIRYNGAQQIWEFCQADCPDGPGASWNTSTNTPGPYGGIWLAQRNSAGGIVATTSALLRFARNHRVKVGVPNEGASGTGSLLPAPASYGSGSSHNGSLPGTRSWLWQMGGTRTNNVPVNWGAWNDDPSAPLDLDQNGNVVVGEITLGSSCTLPSDVAVAVIFNQRQDRRAPTSGGVGSSNSTVYGRILDFLGDAACKVNAQGWPQTAQPPAQLGVLPTCD